MPLNPPSPPCHLHSVSRARRDQYVGLHGSGFRDFMLKPEIMRAIVDCAFEHPSTGATLPRAPPPRHPLEEPSPLATLSRCESGC